MISCRYRSCERNDDVQRESIAVHSFHTRFHVLAGLAGVKSKVSVKYVVVSATSLTAIVMSVEFILKIPIALLTPAWNSYGQCRGSDRLVPLKLIPRLLTPFPTQI